jgi:hypothetical protein
MWLNLGAHASCVQWTHRVQRVLSFFFDGCAIKKKLKTFERSRVLIAGRDARAP